MSLPADGLCPHDHGAVTRNAQLKYQHVGPHPFPLALVATLDFSAMAEAATTTGDFPDRGPAVFAVTISTLVVGTVFFIARILCRAVIVRRVSWDDYFIILAWLLAAALTTAVDVGARYGLGRHDEDIPSSYRLPLRKAEYAFSVLYVCVISCYCFRTQN